MSLALLTSAGACRGPETGHGSSQLATEGRWRAPAHILAEGDRQSDPYTGAGEWFDDERNCEGNFTGGGQVFRDDVLTYFPQVDVVGGYSYRPIVGDPSQTSVHATGRALDLMIRTTAHGDADYDLGDPVAHQVASSGYSSPFGSPAGPRASPRSSSQDSSSTPSPSAIRLM